VIVWKVIQLSTYVFSHLRGDDGHAGVRSARVNFSFLGWTVSGHNHSNTRHLSAQTYLRHYYCQHPKFLPFPGRRAQRPSQKMDVGEAAWLEEQKSLFLLNCSYCEYPRCFLLGILQRGLWLICSYSSFSRGHRFSCL
jgi:hypothetical protein